MRFSVVSLNVDKLKIDKTKLVLIPFLKLSLLTCVSSASCLPSRDQFA